jgi:hypothetical protein
MTLSENGGRLSLRLTLSNLGAIASIITIVSLLTGFWFGYSAFKSEMTTLKQTVEDLRGGNRVLQDRLDSIGKIVAEDRQTLTVRLTALEGEIKYISQGIAELRSIPKR